MDAWTPNADDENLSLEPEDRNEYDKNAVAVIIDGKTGGHISKNLSKTLKRFLTLPNYNKRYWKTCESWCWLRTRDS